MSAQRKLERKRLIFYLKVFGEKTNRLIGDLVDITTEGIRLIGNRPIKTEITYKLRMDLPREINGKREIIFNARSRWCEKDDRTDFYNTGFQLMSISPGDVNRIENLIQEYSHAA